MLKQPRAVAFDGKQKIAPIEQSQDRVVAVTWSRWRDGDDRGGEGSLFPPKGGV